MTNVDKMMTMSIDIITGTKTFNLLEHTRALLSQVFTNINAESIIHTIIAATIIPKILGENVLMLSYMKNPIKQGSITLADIHIIPTNA